ncbi:MAG TPA: peptidyl-prolyl cis-trans isomerase [Solirubrobacterales bacterium]
MGAKSGKSGKASGGSAGRQRLLLIAFGALFAALFVVFAVAEGIGQPSVPSGDVAVVKGVPSSLGTISEAELKLAVLQQAGQSGGKVPKKGTKKYEELQEAAQGELLSAIWLQGLAEEMGITVTEKQVEQELAQIKKTNFPTEKAYQEFLKKSHLSQQEVNEKVKLNVLGTKIQEKISAEAEPASSTEISDYYEAEKATQYTTKPSRDVRVIVNKDKAKVEKAKQELEKDSSPAGWKKVAPKYSEDPTTKTKGGLQPGISEEFLKGSLKKAVFDSATNELVGPVEYEKKFLLIEVVKLNPEKVQSLEEVKSQIATTLNQQKQQEFVSEFATNFNTTWQSRTYCASGFEMERCANYPASKRLQKAREAYKSCYEANPKTPPTECPAPVEQTKPALPGTVTPTKPKGEPFVQRPLPETSAPAVGEEGAVAPEGAAPEAAPEAAPKGK